MFALNPDTYKAFIRPSLFKLSPETAQSAAELALRPEFLWRRHAPFLTLSNARLEVDLAGIRLRNPVGLAAGYDKNCQVLPSLAAMGFGYVTGGTVTESPRPGNPMPRVIRYAKDESLINSLGFPNKGLEHAARQLERSRHARADVPVVVSVSGVTIDEITNCHRRLEPLVDAVEVNISSPNTLGLKAFQEPRTLADLLTRLNELRRKPIFVQQPPYSSPEELPSAGDEGRARVTALADVCMEHGVEALTISNTWPARDSRLAVGSGGISGRVIFRDTIRMVSDIRSAIGDKAAINACGGIFTADDAWDAIGAGATTVQILTGLIYRGPGVVKRINEGLLGRMDREQVVGLGI